MSRNGKRRLGLIGLIIWLLNIVLAIALLFSYLSSYVDPAITTMFSFLGLAYLPLLLANLLFFLYWLLRRNRRLWLSLLVMLIGFNVFTAHIQLLPGREAPTEDVISVLSFNVQNMAFSNTGVPDGKVRGDIIHFLDNQNADIVCLQEYSSRGADEPYVLSDITDKLDYPYIYFKEYERTGRLHIEGKIILSKFPAIDTAVLSTPERNHNFGLYVDLLVKGDTIRLYNLHLESIRFQHADYKFVEEVSKGQAEQISLRRGSSNILRKLHRSFKTRSKEAELVVNSLKSCPYPVIIMGDFNDTPLSFAYHRISKGLNDAFMDAGYGLGNTFNGKLPPVRIDFILYSSYFQAHEFIVHGIELSDHFPVSTYLSKASSK
jgi:endonuclease/exonuclease/phosphatase family metal-dependent hydrolase